MRVVAFAMSLLLSSLAVTPAAAQMTLPPPGEIEPVNGNLYKIFGGGGNTLVYVQEDGVVLVDTKLPNNGQAILDQVRAVTDKPITTIIYSHNHPDHIGSTDFFREHYPDLRVIAHENAGTAMEANPQIRAELRPDETFSDHLTVGEGDERIELHYFGVAHTDNDTFIVFPAERAMFPGDVMAWDMSPLIDPGTGGSMLVLPETLEKVAASLTGIDIVIEGHGAINDWDNFLRFTEFNRALLTAAQDALEAGEAPAAAIAVLQANPRFAPLLGTSLKEGLEYGNTPLARAHMNVNVAYQELSGEPVTTNFGGALPETDKHPGSDAADVAMPGAPPSTPR